MLTTRDKNTFSTNETEDTPFSYFAVQPIDDLPNNSSSASNNNSYPNGHISSSNYVRSYSLSKDPHTPQSTCLFYPGFLPTGWPLQEIERNQLLEYSRGQDAEGSDFVAALRRTLLEIGRPSKIKEKGSAGLVTRSSVLSCVSQECGSVDDVNDGHSGVGKQVIEENKSMSQNHNSSSYLCKDDDDKFSHTWSHEEDYLFSRTSIAVAPEKASPSVLMTTKPDHQVLAERMCDCDVSDWLHYSIIVEEHNDGDCGMLERLISDFQTCTLKDDEQIIPVQNGVFSKSDFGNLGGQSPQPQQKSLVKEAHVSKIGPEQADGDAMGMLGDNFKADQIQGSQHEGDNSTVFDTHMEADEHEEASVLVRPRDLKIKDPPSSINYCADDIAPAIERTGLKTQNQDEASESLSLVDDQEVQSGSWHLVDDQDVQSGSWNLVHDQEMQSGS